MINRIKLAIAATALLGLAGAVRAAPIIVVGDHWLAADTPGQIIAVTIAPGAGDPGAAIFRGLNFYAQVGDGGPELADYDLPPGTDAPAITAVNLKPIGGILADLADPSYDLGSIPQAAARSFVFTGSDAQRPHAEGLLAELTIDTTGFAEGTWSLKLSGVLDFPALGGPFATDLAGDAIEIVNGSIIVPEPATMSLLAAGLIAACRFKRPKLVA